MVQSNAEQITAPRVLVDMVNVERALAGIGIGKNRNNTQQGFKFRGIDDVLNALSGLLAEHNLIVLPKMLSREVVERVSRKGDPLFDVIVHVAYRFRSAVDGSEEVVDIYGEMMDQTDKGTGKALSAAYKSGMIQAFCIPIEGSPEERDGDFTTHELGRKEAPRREPEPEAPASRPEKASAGPETVEDAIKRLVSADGLRTQLSARICKAYNVAVLDQIADADVADAIKSAEKFVAAQAARRAAK